MHSLSVKTMYLQEILHIIISHFFTNFYLPTIKNFINRVLVCNIYFNHIKGNYIRFSIHKSFNTQSSVLQPSNIHYIIIEPFNKHSSIIQLFESSYTIERAELLVAAKYSLKRTCRVSSCGRTATFTLPSSILL